MCYYRTKKDGKLVIPNVESEKVELLYKIKDLVQTLDVHTRLSAFVEEAESVLFEEEGKHFDSWLRCKSAEKVEKVLLLEELELSGRNDYECDTKKNVRYLLRQFLTV